jgi:DNA-binding HxlR family transcriptional regulator
MSLGRSLTILGQRWTLLIVEQALLGTTRFSAFQRTLGIPPDVLSERLALLVDSGVMTRGSYQHPGERRRPCYDLTAAGRDLHVAIAALSDWGDRHLPHFDGPATERRARRTGLRVHVAFIDERGYEVPAEDVVHDPVNPPEFGSVDVGRRTLSSRSGTPGDGPQNHARVEAQES